MRIIKKLLAGFSKNQGALSHMVVTDEFVNILEEVQGKTTLPFIGPGAYHHTILSLRDDIARQLPTFGKEMHVTEPGFMELKETIIHLYGEKVWWQFLALYWFSAIHDNGKNIPFFGKLSDAILQENNGGAWLHREMCKWYVLALDHDDPINIGYHKFQSWKEVSNSKNADHVFSEGYKVYVVKEDERRVYHNDEWVLSNVFTWMKNYVENGGIPNTQESREKW